MIRSVWFIVVPMMGGYAGQCKAGSFWGRTRMDVISLMLERSII